MTTKRIPPYLRTIILRKTIPYEVATEIQEHLVAKQLAYKASQCRLSASSYDTTPPTFSSSSSPTTTSSSFYSDSINNSNINNKYNSITKNENEIKINNHEEKPPEPYLFMFGSSPVYTLGRRERITDLPQETLRALMAPMPGIPGRKSKASEPHRAFLFETKRGGQTTFHGPGQLLIWPILDLKTPWPACGPLDVRRYVQLLEECTMITLKSLNCDSIRTKHPGVWDVSGESKIAALGVHLRRNITSYGVACNLNTDLRFFDRIVACGLKGKKTTTLRKLTDKALHPGDFAEMWAENFANLLYGPLDSTSSSSSISISSKHSARILKGSVRMTGVGPDLLRRLWYLDAPKQVIKWAQKQKKISLPYDNSSISDETTHSRNSNESNVSTFSSIEAEDANPICSEISGTSTRIQDLLAILDKNEQKAAPPSFRKCAGISYWTPPIGGPSSTSIVRKVGVTCYRGQEIKK
ncbi:Octanoyltransferase, mitochondrial [Erysiphe neolycopersici]|uniref:lipoyl(octanoyl) transferase n=1 Tax=Erysiphe neolycopersici TaxID=212602 RepID=A0A420HZB2_9PEZI|nr:Octanoyltransferase, mitochondrial [Erysiphe neolycopersici]